MVWRTACALVTSRSRRAKAITTVERARSSCTSSAPTWPPAPVTSQRTSAARGREQRAPPVFVRLVPGDGLGKAVTEGVPRLIAKGPQPAVVECVSAVVTTAVLDVLHRVPVRVHGGKDQL